MSIDVMAKLIAAIAARTVMGASLAWFKVNESKGTIYSCLWNREQSQGNQTKANEPIKPVNETKEDNADMCAQEANLRKA